MENNRKLFYFFKTFQFDEKVNILGGYFQEEKYFDEIFLVR